MKIGFRPSLRIFKIIIFISFGLFVLFYFLFIHDKFQSEVRTFRQPLFNSDAFANNFPAPKLMNYPMAQNYDRKDWHDWEFIKYEAHRIGPGEQGKPFVLTDPEDIKRNEKLFETEGNFVVASDKISVNRSVPDTRLPQ